MSDLFTQVGADTCQPETTAITVIHSAEAPKIFWFQGSPVRTKVIDGEPMFCLSDVCKALEIANSRDCKSRMNPDGVGTTDIIDSMGRTQQATFINESNLYKAVFQSRTKKAEEFTEWVTGEVLPSIRKKGEYKVETIKKGPQMVIEAIEYLQELNARQQEQIEAQGEQLKPQAPDVDYCRTVLSSSSLITVNTIATHIGISAKRLNAFLDFEGWIYKQGKTWYPSFKIRDRGYCDYETVPYINREGERCTTCNLKWTESGRRAVIELWNKRHGAGKKFLA